MYDFANSSFAVIIVAFVFAVYFKKVVAGNAPVGDLYWAISINISMLIVALLNPILGAAADIYSNKKTFLIFFTLLSVTATSLLYFTGEGTLVYAMGIFILANIGFQTALSFYDAFLPELVSPAEYNTISARGYALGYVGSLVAVLIVLPMKETPRLTFLVTAGMFFLFSLPAFFFLQEKKRSPVIVPGNFFSVGVRRVLTTLSRIREYAVLRNFLIAYFVYIDGVNTIIFFAGNFAQSTLHFSLEELAYFFIIVQITAMFGALLFGKIADRTGTKQTLLAILCGWLLVTVAMFLIADKFTFFLIGSGAGLFLGSSQALSRSIMSLLTPEDHRAEFFGFYALFEKTATILGPLVFGIISALTANQRIASLALGLFFLAGIFLLQKIPLSSKT
jgi:UMF1 family MFS transporter